MVGLELEVKVLDVDLPEVDGMLRSLGGEFVGLEEQRLFTYDLPAVDCRYDECVLQLQNAESRRERRIARERMLNLAVEIDEYLGTPNGGLIDALGVDSFESAVRGEVPAGLLLDVTVRDMVAAIGVNEKKWIRLRESNGKATLAVKQVLDPASRSLVQRVRETEVAVSSFDGANALLEQLGFFHKSYQEKMRYVYRLFDRELDVDCWPGIPPYLEFEGESEEDIARVLGELGYDASAAVSCTADDVYRLYGKSMFDSGELRFSEEERALYT